VKEIIKEERKPLGQVYATRLAKGGKTNEMEPQVDFAIVINCK